MIDEDELVREITGLQRAELHRWIAEGWVMPARRGAAYVYREVDVARVRLIVDMRSDLSVGDDALPLVLSLVDQLYSVRRELKQMAEAINAQPEEVRQRIVSHLEAISRG